MTKLVNRKTIQYIKQGQVLYGQNGDKISSESFPEIEFKQRIRNRFAAEYWKLHPRTPFDKRFPNESRKIADKEVSDFQQAFNRFLIDNYDFVPNSGGKYLNKNSSKRKKRLENEALIKELKPTQYSKSGGYYRDDNGFLYKYTKNSDKPELIKDDVYLNGTNKLMLKSYDPSQSKDPEDKIADIKEIQGDDTVRRDYGQGEVYYYKVKTKNGDRWAARYKNPTNGQKSGWWWVAEESTGYDKNGNHNRLRGGQWIPESEEKSSENKSSENGSSENGTSGSQTSSTQTSSDGPAPTEFTAASQETDRRDIVPSVIQSTLSPQMTPATTALLPKVTPVARPANMPLMNRGDVRYTISDVTGGSPYFSSDIELVNGLAGAPDNNMFKQALMNRLGMDKWDSSTALNRLNFLGIKGSIGGSDRRRIRNLINNGTTIAGKIRK